MDPLTAFALAGTVVQFVDFGTKLLLFGRELYRSAGGTLEPYLQLELVTADLVAICDKLQRVKDIGHGLERVCDEATKVAQELLRRLNRLKVTKGQGVGRHRMWKTLQQAFAITWSKDDVEQLVSRLSRIREAIETNILFSLGENVSLLSVQFSARFSRLDQQTQQIVRALATQHGPSAEPSREFQEQLLALTQLLSRLEASNLEEHRKTRAMIIDRSLDSARGEILASPKPLGVTRDEEEVVRFKVMTKILESLYFSTMMSRYEEVSEAYNETFNWVFYDPTTEQRPWSSFRDWLIRGSGVYWVNGKAGSGKSTLMRYVIDDPRTQQYLRQWAKGFPLSTARFFFWNSGSRDQSSQLGLLRALLHDLLSQRPELIPVVFPGCWAKAYSDNVRDFTYTPIETWSLTKLMAGFKILVTQKIVPLNLCLFIDGLDEYEGDHEEMAELFHTLTSSATVKACLSSRP